MSLFASSHPSNKSHCSAEKIPYFSPVVAKRLMSRSELAHHSAASAKNRSNPDSVGKSMMSPPPKHALNRFSYPFLSSWRSPPFAGAENYSERTLEKLSLCDDIAIVMFAVVFRVCSEKSKDQCVCLRLSEVRLIHHLNTEEPPSTP
jgi:hypothetical protein